MNEEQKTPEEKAAPEAAGVMEVPAQLRFGVFVYYVHGDEEPKVHVQADPEIDEVSYGEIYRMLNQAAQNVEHTILAEKVVQRLRAEAKNAPRIVRP